MAFELTIEEKRFLESLNRHNVRFIIVGLTSAVLQSSHVVTQDIDLWIEDLGGENFLRAIKEQSAFYVPAGLVGLNPPMLGPNTLSIFDLVVNMQGLESFAVEYDGAKDSNISGVPVKLLPLDRIIKSKETANREKDRASLPALRATLKLLQK